MPDVRYEECPWVCLVTRKANRGGCGESNAFKRRQSAQIAPHCGTGGAKDEQNNAAKRPNRQRPSATPRTTDAAEDPIDQIPTAAPTPASSPAPVEPVVDPTMDSADSFDLLEPIETTDIVPEAATAPAASGSTDICRSAINHCLIC